MRKTIILIIAAALACATIVYAGAKGFETKDERMIELQNQLIAEQNEIWQDLSEQYRTKDLECVGALNDLRGKMDESHNIAEAYRTTIKALQRQPLDFSLPQNQ